MTTPRDPRDLTQYCILKWWQFWLYFSTFFVCGALLGVSIGVGIR